MLLGAALCAAAPAEAGRRRTAPDPWDVHGGVASDVTYDGLAGLFVFQGVPATIANRWFSNAPGGLLPLGDDANLASGCRQTAPCASQALAKALLEAGPVHVHLDPGDGWAEFGDISSLACTPGEPCQFITGAWGGLRAHIVCSLPDAQTQAYIFGWEADVRSGARAYVQGFDTSDPSCKGYDHYSVHAGQHLVVLNAIAVSEQTSSTGNHGHSFVTKTGGEMVVIHSRATQRDDGGTRCSQPAAFTDDTRATLLHVDLENADDDCSRLGTQPDKERILRLQTSDVAFVGGSLRWTGTGGGVQRSMAAIHNGLGPASLVLARVRAEGLPDGDPQAGLPRPQLLWAPAGHPWTVQLFEVTSVEISAGLFVSPQTPSSFSARGWLVDRRRGATPVDAPIVWIPQAGREANLTLDISESFWDEDDNGGKASSFKVGATNYGPVTSPDTGCPEAALGLAAGGATIVNLFDGCDPAREIGGVGVDGRAELSASVGGAQCSDGWCTGPGAWHGTYAVTLPAAVDEVVLGPGNAFSAFLLEARGTGAEPR